MFSKISLRRTISILIMGAVSLLAAARGSSAATHTWTGTTSANWSAPGNWSEGTAPAPGESNVVLVFPLGAARQTNTNDIMGLTVDSITVSSSSSPYYSISGNGLTLNTSLTFSNAGSGSYPQWEIPLTLGGDAAIANSGRMTDIRGTIDLNGHALTFDCAKDIWAYGVISGSGSLVKDSAGSLFLDAANTYSGPTMANAGNLYMANVTALGDTGTGTTLNATSALGLWGADFTSAEPLTFAGGGIKENASHTLSGTITLNADAAITVGNGPLTISGSIVGTGGLTKLGYTGLLILAGTGAYAGVTQVKEGDLSVTGSITSNVVITGSAARLMGSGSVGAISFTASGTVYPSVGGTGTTLTSNGGFTGRPGAHFLVDVTPANYGRLVVNGPVNLDGITIIHTSGSPASYPPHGQTYKLIENDGTDAVTGTFTSASSYASLPEGGMDSGYGLEFNITYAGNTGNDVQMQVPLFRHAVADLDGDPADEAAIDFGANGIWLLDGGAWTQISPSNPEALIPANLQPGGGREIVADLGTLGLWLWAGGAWSNLTPANPENHAVADPDGDGVDEVVADLGSLGLWFWNAGTWNILSSVDVESMTAGDVDGDAMPELVADFGPVGLWVLDAGAWTQLSGANADFVHAADLDMDTTAELAIDFGRLGLWSWDGGAWTQLSGLDPEHTASGRILGPSSRQLLASFLSQGFWYLDGSSWTCLSTYDAKYFICLDVDGLRGEDLFGDFYVMSFWQWDGLGWLMLSQLDPGFMTGGDLDGDALNEILGDFGPAGLWLYDAGNWTKISDKDAQ